MKSFRSYLTESEKTYSFRIKIAGDVDSNRVDALETALEKYELKSLSKPNLIQYYFQTGPPERV